MTLGRPPTAMTASPTQPRDAAPVPHYTENGRAYCAFRKGSYIFPCDEKEQNRLDMFHTLFLRARHDELHKAPVKPEKGVRIMDLGTGTGIWAIDMAEKFPNAEVIGIDFANIQPPSIPRNLRFDIEVDYTSPWSFGEDSWDFIHLRQGLGSVHNWRSLYSQVFRHLKPQHGRFEQVEIDLEPRCDDGTLSEVPVKQWYNYLCQATDLLHKPIKYPQDTRTMLQQAGFIDIEEQVIRAPFNSWPRDEHQREIGRWYCAGLLEWLEALSMGPMTRAFDWKQAQVTMFVNTVSQTILTKSVHAYNNIHIWTARRPG